MTKTTIEALVAKWRALARIIREGKGGRNYRRRHVGWAQSAMHVDDCADELEAALATLRAELDGLRAFVRDCADGLPEWKPDDCRKRAISLLAAIQESSHEP